MDYRDVKNVRSINLTVERQRKSKIFNLYNAILPKIADDNNDGKRNRQTELQDSSFEYQIVSKLFLDTFNGAAVNRNNGLFGGPPAVA